MENDEALKEQETTSSETTTALTMVNMEALNKESLAIINQLIAESDVDKTKDLTYLFNINQNKKTMARMDKLSNLQDQLVNQFAKRLSERPDEMSNQEVLTGLKIVQDILERSQKQVVGVSETPLIQINQQTNQVKVGDTPLGLTRDSRERVKNVVLDLLNSINTVATDNGISEDKVYDYTGEGEKK